MFDCQLHPVITVDGMQYFIIAKCFSSSVIQGHATNVWFVTKSILAGSDPNNIFVVKDSWVNAECQLSEEQIFEALKNIECVLKVKEAWTVQQDGQDDLMSLHHPVAFMSHFKQPFTHAASPLEVVTCLLDLIIGPGDHMDFSDFLRNSQFISFPDSQKWALLISVKQVAQTVRKIRFLQQFTRQPDLQTFDVWDTQGGSMLLLECWGGWSTAEYWSGWGGWNLGDWDAGDAGESWGGWTVWS
ncbi:hypothetical protein EDC04DRAFT_2598029 [Pisolithus marmoratus]|nr:hypothetical protein EDC04DRAFT_2598029 [Pisolithus marmoratus]